MESTTDKLTRAIELQTEGRVEEATGLFREVLATEPRQPAALYSLSVILLGTGEHAEALLLSTQGCVIAPAFAPMRFVQGIALQSLGRKEEALQSYDAALKIDTVYVEALINSGVLLRDMARHHEAVERFERVLAINPNHATAIANCGMIFTEFKKSDRAIAMFERLLQLDPDYDYGPGLLSYEKLHICDWSNFDALTQRIKDGIRAGKRSCKSLAFMALSDSAEDHYAAARLFAGQFFPKVSRPLWNGERYRHKRIRLAYVSADLREHPVGHLMAGVLERHDKSRFETIAISIGVNDQSRLRARMLKAFDQFIEARHMTLAQIAQLMREKEIDIAVDLTGYTVDSRSNLFAYRPAPVQVNYLGYPGTLGADCFDYILADRHIIPTDHQAFYSEKVVYLPDTYLPTDAGVKIADRTPTRAECGLPPKGVVFCSFSHDYKITPPLFDIWMRLLQRVPDSVLWLMSRSEVSQLNLRREAQQRGINPERLVFATRVPLVEDHLARYRLADIFLDTHPYNAHTTAADALMGGLPVVTYMGNAFPARVAGSLLHAIGMPELIAHSFAEYEELAVKLVTNPALLADVKERLKANRATHALFDTDGFCRNLEAAYIAMWRRSQLGDARDEL